MYGAKWTFALSILLSSILTLIFPTAAKSSFGLALFLRAFTGLFSSLMCPSVYYFFPGFYLLLLVFPFCYYACCYYVCDVMPPQHWVYIILSCLAWIPICEKTIMISSIGSGIYAGEIIGFSVSGVLVSHDIWTSGGTNLGGWPSAFYFFGIIGVCWCVLYYFFMV